MRITLSDDLGDALQSLADASHKPVDEVAAILIERTIGVPLTERHLILSGEARQAVESRLGAHCKTPQELVEAIDKLASIQFGQIRLKLSPKHLSELKRRAAKRSMTLKAFVAELAAEIEPLFMDRMSGFGVTYTPVTKAAQEAHDAAMRAAG
jgi:transposase